MDKHTGKGGRWEKERGKRREEQVLPNANTWWGCFKGICSLFSSCNFSKFEIFQMQCWGEKYFPFSILRVKYKTLQSNACLSCHMFWPLNTREPEARRRGQGGVILCLSAQSLGAFPLWGTLEVTSVECVWSVWQWSSGYPQGGRRIRKGWWGRKSVAHYASDNALPLSPIFLQLSPFPQLCGPTDLPLLQTGHVCCHLKIFMLVVSGSGIPFPLILHGYLSLAIHFCPCMAASPSWRATSSPDLPWPSNPILPSTLHLLSTPLFT